MAARSKTGSRRTVIVHLRLTLQENAALMGACAAKNLTVSEGLRRLAREAGGLGPTLEADEREAIGALTSQIRAIGVNLNQAVRAMNVGHMPEGGLLRGALTGLSEALREANVLYAGLCRKAQARRLAALGAAPAPGARV
jgi:hypothetical protein